MIDMRDSRGIATFTVRFLLFYVVVLLVSCFLLLPGLTFLLSIGIMGFFTFIQVMVSISRKFLDQPVAWKAAVIAGAIVFDGAVLWLLGLLLVVVFDGGSAWIAVAEWLPSHVVAALCAWGLREFFRWLSPRVTATPSASDSPADPAETENPGDSNVADAPAVATGVTDTDTDTDRSYALSSSHACNAPRQDRCSHRRCADARCRDRRYRRRDIAEEALLIRVSSS